MEGIVAKRTLKKSYYNNKNINSVGFEAIPFSNSKDNKTKTDNSKVKSGLAKYKEKWLYKMSIQAITMISIIAFVLAIKYLKINVVIEADITKKIVSHYQKSYSASQIASGAKSWLKAAYIFTKPIIPDNVENKAKELYRVIMTKEENIDTKKETNNELENNNESNNEVKIYEEASDINKEVESKENVGVSVDNEEDEEKVVAVSSSVSSASSIIDEIKETKIEFIKPVSGTITSNFGAREVIFEGIDSYHTGTDIAANTGTKVVSSIAGKVTRATYNKYNGNFVEVTNGDVATIYCHMSKISVKVGDSVKAGTKIGEVGSTGLSTGPHLHFEIVYDGTKIDPELILDL